MKLDSLGHCGEDMHIAIGERRVIMPGMTVRGNSNEFVAVDLGYEASPLISVEVIESARRNSPGWRFSQEYELNWDAQTGAPVFEEEWVSAQQVHASNPIQRMDIHTLRRNGVIQRDSLGHERQVLVQKDDGRLKVYVMPDEQAGQTLTLRHYGIGMDVGAGVEKSDSTIQVMSAWNREQAASLACNTIEPSELGRFAALVGKWYNNALICCVLKMHGLTALRAITDVGYPMIWRTTSPKRGIVESRTKNLGWPYGEVGDLLLGRWRDALATPGLVTLHDLQTIQQHRQYVYDEHARACHQLLRSEPIAVRQSHGDLVIGAALAYRAVIDLPMYLRVAPEPPPARSAAGRHEQRKKAAKQKETGGW